MWQRNTERDLAVEALVRRIFPVRGEENGKSVVAFGWGQTNRSVRTIAQTFGILGWAFIWDGCYSRLGAH